MCIEASADSPVAVMLSERKYAVSRRAVSREKQVEGCVSGPDREPR